MPEDPTILNVHKRLTGLFETITPANGFRHDMSESVYRGRGVFGDETPIPAISILQAPIPDQPAPQPGSGTEQRSRQELVIQGFVEDDRLNPTDPAHLLLAEVKQVLAIERRKIDYSGGPENGILGLGRTVTDLYIGAGVVRPADEISDKAYFWLNLTLEIVEDLADPFGQ
jgi:hypothetical protein